MMQLFGPNGNVIGFFKTLDELFIHINAVENEKLLKSTSCAPERIWSFTLFTNKRLSYVYYRTLERSFSKIGREAVERELDLIEISKGNNEEFLQIPVTPDVDVQELKKNWCYEYCDAHDYVLVECQDHFEIPSTTVEAIPEINAP